MKVTKPKTLYRYFNMKLEKHRITKECMPQVELRNHHGVLFRCRSGDHDLYGYATLQEAKKEEIETVEKGIYDRKEWLKDHVRESVLRVTLTNEEIEIVKGVIDIFHRCYTDISKMPELRGDILSIYNKDTFEKFIYRIQTTSWADCIAGETLRDLERKLIKAEDFHPNSINFIKGIHD